MKEKTDKIMTLVLLGLAIIATVFAVIFALNTVTNSAMFDIAFWLMVIMIAISILAILIFLCKKLGERFRTEPGYLKKFLILCVIIIAVLVISFLLAKGNDVSAAMLEKNNLTEGTSKLIGAACILCYIITIGAALAIVVSEIMPKSNKKK